MKKKKPKKNDTIQTPEFSPVATKPLPQTESTPVKFYECEEGGLGAIVKDQTKFSSMLEIFKEITGVKDGELALQIVDSARAAIEPLAGQAQSFNLVSQAIYDLEPKDSVEARLAGQAHALYTLGMLNLKRAEKADPGFQADHFGNTALKLLRLHNETILALSKYRRGGEQRVIVQHVNVADGGKAVVGGQINQGGGGTSQSEGAPHA